MMIKAVVAGLKEKAKGCAEASVRVITERPP